MQTVCCVTCKDCLPFVTFQQTPLSAPIPLKSSLQAAFPQAGSKESFPCTNTHVFKAKWSLRCHTGTISHLRQSTVEKRRRNSWNQNEQCRKHAQMLRAPHFHLSFAWLQGRTCCVPLRFAEGNDRHSCWWTGKQPMLSWDTHGHLSSYDIEWSSTVQLLYKALKQTKI